MLSWQRRQTNRLRQRLLCWWRQTGKGLMRLHQTQVCWQLRRKLVLMSHQTLHQRLVLM